MIHRIEDAFSRYADAVPWEFLRAARDRGTALSLVLNRVPGDAGREVAHRLVAEGVPVRDRDTVGMEAVVLFAHRTRADAGAPDRIASGGHQTAWNFVMSPRATMEVKIFLFTPSLPSVGKPGSSLIFTSHVP